MTIKNIAAVGINMNALTILNASPTPSLRLIDDSSNDVNGNGYDLILICTVSGLSVYKYFNIQFEYKLFVIGNE